MRLNGSDAAITIFTDYHNFYYLLLRGSGRLAHFHALSPERNFGALGGFDDFDAGLEGVAEVGHVGNGEGAGKVGGDGVDGCNKPIGTILTTFIAWKGSVRNEDLTRFMICRLGILPGLKQPRRLSHSI